MKLIKESLILSPSSLAAYVTLYSTIHTGQVTAVLCEVFISWSKTSWAIRYKGVDSQFDRKRKLIILI
jgi:hypothetical protein